jgi:hypothetical protein
VTISRVAGCSGHRGVRRGRRSADSDSRAGGYRSLPSGLLGLDRCRSTGSSIMVVRRDLHPLSVTPWGCVRDYADLSLSEAFGSAIATTLVGTVLVTSHHWRS